jgi:hypothetical protein
MLTGMLALRAQKHMSVAQRLFAGHSKNCMGCRCTAAHANVNRDGALLLQDRSAPLRSGPTVVMHSINAAIAQY